MKRRATYVPVDYQDLYEHYFSGEKETLVRGLVVRYAGGWVQDEQDVEDLVQDIFTRMLRLKQLEKFDPSRGNFGLYLQQITRSVVFSWRRKQERTPTKKPQGGATEEVADFLMESLQSEASDPEELAQASSLVRYLNSVAETVAEGEGAGNRERAMPELLEVLFGGGEAKDAAAQLGVAASTVSQWRQHLRAVAGL